MKQYLINHLYLMAAWFIYAENFFRLFFLKILKIKNLPIIQVECAEMAAFYYLRSPKIKKTFGIKDE